MKGDFTRKTFKKKKHYRKVNMQQGRVQLDVDWNEQVDIGLHYSSSSLQDVIGQSGAPLENPGFKIVPYENEYKIEAGHYYVDGLLCENEMEVRVSEQEDLPIEKIFRWEDVPGDHSSRLKSFLSERFYAEWVDKEEVRFKKSDNEKITAESGGNSLSIKLDKERTKVVLKINRDESHKLFVKRDHSTRLNEFLSSVLGTKWTIEHTKRLNGFLRKMLGAKWKERHGEKLSKFLKERPDAAKLNMRLKEMLDTEWTQNETYICYKSPALPEKPGDFLYLAYLDVWERHLTGLDDPEILEPALGGADTATRTKIVWQVRIVPVDARAPTPEQWQIFWSMGDINRDGYINDVDLKLIEAAFGSAPGDPNWDPRCDIDEDGDIDVSDTAKAAKNYGKNIWDHFGLHACNCISARQKMPSASTGRMRARSKRAKPSDEPCILPPRAGYRRLQNQLYRVEIHNGGEVGNPEKPTPTFKWSRDNGSVVAEITEILSDSEQGHYKLVVGRTLPSKGKPTEVGFSVDQWVEVTDNRHELWGIPGTFVKLKDVEDNRLEFDPSTVKGESLTSENFPRHFKPKVRRWDRTRGQDGLIEVAIPNRNDGFIELEDGVEVRFEKGTYYTGDYWLIPARTVKADVEWPRYPCIYDLDRDSLGDYWKEDHTRRLNAFLKGMLGADWTKERSEKLSKRIKSQKMLGTRWTETERRKLNDILGPMLGGKWTRTRSGKLNDFLERTSKPLPPEGIKHHYSPLALLKYNGRQIEVISDCRVFFPAITDLDLLYYIGGDGQEGPPGCLLPFPLMAGVAIGKKQIEGATVRFKIEEGGGRLLDENNEEKEEVDLETVETGLVRCRWKLGKNTPDQRVRAVLLDAGGNEIGLPLYFNATLDRPILYYGGGDGQEALPRKTLPFPLVAGVAIGKKQIEGATVRFKIEEGGGRLLDENNEEKEEVDLETVETGLVRCRWKLGEKGAQQVKVVLLDADGEETDLKLCYNAFFASEPQIISANAGKITLRKRWTKEDIEKLAGLLRRTKGERWMQDHASELKPIYEFLSERVGHEFTKADIEKLKGDAGEIVGEQWMRKYGNEIDAILTWIPGPSTFGPFNHWLQKIDTPPGILLGFPQTKQPSVVAFMEDHGLYDFGKALPRFKVVNVDSNVFYVRVEGAIQDGLALRWWAIPAQEQKAQTSGPVVPKITLEPKNPVVGGPLIVTVVDPLASGTITVGLSKGKWKEEAKIKLVETDQPGVFRGEFVIADKSKIEVKPDEAPMDIPGEAKLKIVASYTVPDRKPVAADVMMKRS